MTTKVTTATNAQESDCRFHVLSLDGGGSKGAYTLGVLRVVEELLKPPLCERFQLVYGTSTGAIIASMVALGDTVETIWDRYRSFAPAVGRQRSAKKRSAKLRTLASEIYNDRKFDSFQTRVGIVATKVAPHEPMIFKSHENQLLKSSGDFVPGFGATIAEAVVSSCSAQPYFKEFVLDLDSFGKRTLIDGGHMANNPTPLALIDTLQPLVQRADCVRVLSVGTGGFLEKRGLHLGTLYRRICAFRRLMMLLESSTRTMEWLNNVLYGHIDALRINETHPEDDYRTSFLETNVGRLEKIYSAGVEDADKAMPKLRELFGVGDSD